LRNRRVSNNPTIHNSDEPQEDYSEITRGSNSYNVLSFNGRHNAISTLNTMDEEDVYDEGGAVIANRNHDYQDSYVTLPLQRNQMKPAARFEKNIYSTATKVDDEKYGDSYVILAVTQNEAAGNNTNGNSISQLITSQTECSDTYDDTQPKFQSNYYKLEK
jgi:hypothetical protein